MTTFDITNGINIYVNKPGLKLHHVPGKTNLQLMEVKALMQALATATGSDVLYLPSQLLQTKPMHSNMVCIFCHAKTFADEFDKTMQASINWTNTKLVLISNDCRLPFIFKSYDAKWKKAFFANGNTIEVWTNATVGLDEYKEICFIAGDNETLPFDMHIDAMNLYILPSFSQAQPVNNDKLAGTCYFCMHFKDYDKKRQTQLTELSEKICIDFFGDCEPLVHAEVIDAKDVIKSMLRYKSTPVLLEASYEYFGVLPNRIVEAIVAGVVPVVLTNNKDFIETHDELICVSTVDELANVLYDLNTNYIYYQLSHKKAVTMFQKQLQVFLQSLTNAFVRQL